MVNKYVKRARKAMRKGRYSRYTPLIIIGLLVVIGGGWLILSLTLNASTPTTASLEASSGTLTGCATNVSDPTASGGQAVKFAACSSSPNSTAGAQLPISYSISSLTGTVLYVSPSGSDSGSGSVSSPFATLAKAISAAPSGATIVLRGGTYHQANLSLNKTLTITAYPGEIPVFDGSITVPNSSGWTTSGNLSYRSYTPMPVTDGSGISFSTCQNQNGGSQCVGRYPDQVWVGATQYQQVYAVSSVTSGKFWVDQSNNRLYMLTSDLNTSNPIAVSSLRHFMTVSAPNVTLRGFKLIRFSDTPNDYGVINIDAVSDKFIMDQMYISDSAFEALTVSPNGGDSTNSNSIIENSSILNSNWMGIGLNQTTSFTIDHCLISNMGQFGEFTSSPQSGAVKTSRTWYTHILNSKIINAKSQGIWFDESNYMAVVANNDIENVTGSSIFFEISDFMYAINNYINAPAGATAIKAAGSSDIYVINNTLIGAAPLTVFTDSRSIPGCSDPNVTCPVSLDYAHRDTNPNHPRPSTLTWMPSINLVINNIIAYPTSANCYGPTVGFCITQSNATASVALNTILHPANPSKNIPQTLIDGNVYANGGSNVLAVMDQSGKANQYINGSAFGSAMAGAPVSIGGFEAHGYTGNTYVNSDGTQTGTLAPLNNNAVAIPTDTTINQYIPAGTRHYGTTWR